MGQTIGVGEPEEVSFTIMGGQSAYVVVDGELASRGDFELDGWKPSRIDATVEHLDQTNKWLSQLDEFKDLVGDMPATELRVGYQAAPWAPP